MHQLTSMKHLLTLYIASFIYSFAGAQTAPVNSLTQTLLSDTASLPLHQFTVTEKDRKALLRWRADSLAGAESFYAVERSNNGIDFSLVGVTKTTSSGWTEFLDDSPPAGKVFYRVKLTAGQTSFYSDMIAAAPAVDASCRFYPNPVDKVLIVKSEFGVDVQITNQAGKPLITEKCPAGLKVIDVSALDPGLYVITLLQKSGRQVVEKLLKK